MGIEKLFFYFELLIELIVNICFYKCIILYEDYIYIYKYKS